MSGNSTQYQTITSLRLRSTPEITGNNIMTILPPYISVTSIDNDNGWTYVSVEIDGTLLTGYVSSEYIRPVSDTTSTTPNAQNIQPVNMQVINNNGGRLNLAGDRVYPLNETNMPKREEDADSATKTQQLYQILNFLDVEKSIRYKPANGTTYCNIYAYDFAMLAGTYIPRVWWTGRALVQLGKGNSQPVNYGETIREMTANELFNWFKDFGPDFGWRRLFDTDNLQAEVNTGKVGIIVAQRKELARPGHIDIVIPENDTNKAIRKDNKVVMPLQSQAGATNKKTFTSRWYLSSNFREFAYWVHS